jgi:hypothetical protein
MNVHRGNGSKVHVAVVGPTGTLFGTNCALDTRYGQQVGRNLTPTTEAVNCKTCLGNVAPVSAAPVVVPEFCPTHPTGQFYATKTIKAGTYTQFACGCKVWH